MRCVSACPLTVLVCVIPLPQDCVSTHDKQMLFATSCARLAEVGDLWQGYDVIGVDEGQFFPDLISFCETAANAGKIVIVAALDGTFQRKVCVLTVCIICLVLRMLCVVCLCL